MRKTLKRIIFLNKHGGEEGMKLDEKAIAILKALKELGRPATCSEIAEKTGINVRSVTGKMRGLLNAGYVERPEKGKYVITPKGEEVIKEA